MVTYQESNQEILCSFKGILNTANCLSIENELLEKTAHSKKIIFDLKEVTYVCSGFLRICTQLAITKGTEALQVINMSPEIKKVFKISGIDQFLQST